MSILRDTTSGLGLRIGMITLAAVARIVIANRLGPEDQGRFYLLANFSYLAATILSMGLSSPMMIFVARKRYPSGAMHALAIRAAVIIAGVAALLYFVLGEVIRATVLQAVPGALIWVSVLLIPLRLYQDFGGAILIGLGRIVQMNRFTLAAKTAEFAVVAAVLFLAHRGLTVVFGGMAAVALLSGLVLFRILSVPSQTDRQWNSALTRDSFLFGIKMHMNSIASAIRIRADSYILNNYRGPGAVGTYSVGMMWAESLLMLTGPLGVALQPRVAGAQKEGSIRLTLRATRYSFFVTTLLVAISYGVSPWLIPLVFGESFAASVRPLYLLLPGIWLMGGLSFLSIYLSGQAERPGVLAVLASANAAINIALCLLLAPRYGAEGTALAFSITSLLGSIPLLVVFRNYTGARLRDLVFLNRDDITYAVGRITSGARRFRGGPASADRGQAGSNSSPGMS